jgi:hypothetical protein
VGAPIVLGDDFDVLMTVASVELVLDPEVREMHRLIEVRQVVVACPRFDLAGVTIRSPVTVRPAAVVFLQPFLILALEFVFQSDTANVSALLAEALLLAQVGAIELDVVRQLTPPVDARIKRLLTGVLAITTMRLQEMMAALRQRHGTFAAVERHESGQALIAEMAEIAASRFG